MRDLRALWFGAPTLLACGTACAPTATAPPAPAPHAETEEAAPAAEPPAQAPPALAGGLTSDQPEVQKVRSDRAPVLRRRCFEPLFAAHPHLAAGGVTVSCALVVAPDGVVTQAEARHAEYPELAACVQAQVRNWIFPRSEKGGAMTFKFVGLSKG